MSTKEKKIEELKNEIEKLKKELYEKEQQLNEVLSEKNNTKYSILSHTEVSRYSRQMIMPQITCTGQVKFKKSKVLIVGIGGLGCPAALYLAAAGIGELTLVDNDEVELTNLHRQVLHSESSIGVPKVLSGFNTLKRINSNIKIIPLKMHANSSTIENLIKSNNYDVVVDGTDNVATRYLLNDVCVLNKIPLVSGSALQMEGQLTVYNYKNGPCYRCIFPVPPPANTVTSCGDGGVLGVVPGTIGVLQALEVIKILSDLPGVLSGKLILFDGSDTKFRTIKLRSRNINCDICGDSPKITKLIDYELFCNAKAHDKVENIDILQPEELISIKEFINEWKKDVLVVDVRPDLEFYMCKLPNTINIPFPSIVNEEGFAVLEEEINNKCITNRNVYVICRRGNDSQRAVKFLKNYTERFNVKFINVIGGLHNYSKYVDSSFPIY